MNWRLHELDTCCGSHSRLPDMFSTLAGGNPSKSAKHAVPTALRATPRSNVPCSSRDEVIIQDFLSTKLSNQPQPYSSGH